MAKIIITIVKGGLGNQLFIYAAARALAVRTGSQLYLDTRRGYLADGYGRGYRLDRFPIQASIMPEAWRVAPTLRHFRHKGVRALNKLLPRSWRSYLAERRHLDARQLTEWSGARDRVTLLGYWQTEDYFCDHAALIRRELAPPLPADARNLKLGEAMAGETSIFLHVRRVRYTPLLDANYYQQAIEAARGLVSNPHFYLFGDDVAWAKETLRFADARVTLVDHNQGDELADLWLMSRCRHAIVANSTFSWWAAWLGPASRGHVWAPAKPGLPLVYPKEWALL